ncbi:unnamed protein product [Prunus brigantina]
MDPKNLRLTCQVSQDQVSSNMVDRISELPDVILVTIVSCLRALKEKVATSILSKRWRYVWVYTTTLDFGGPDDMQIDAYVKRVNSVVDQHRGGNVEKFRVYIDLVDERYKSSTGRWLHFAAKRRVQKLELFVSRNDKYDANMEWSYTSCLQNLHGVLGTGGGLGSPLKHLCGSPESVNLCPCRYSCLKFLKSIDVRSNRMTAEVVECFLSNCVFLERVSLLGAESGNLRVVGSSIALKHLELHSCYFESVEIHDANLVSLIYYGPKINLLLRNVSRLTEVSINYLPPVRMIEDFSQLFLCCSQLEVLKLDTTWLYEEDHTFLKLPNLTHLELEFAAEDNCCLLKLASFLEASPNLQKLVLEEDNVIFHFFLVQLSGTRSLFIPTPSGEIEIKEASNCSHHSLRVVELRDYRGRTSDFKLVIYLVENALELEKIVIGALKYPHLVMKREQREVDHATQQLQEKLPKRIQFVCSPMCKIMT